MRENKYFRTDFLEKLSILAPLATDPLNTIITFTSPEKKQDFVVSLGAGLESLVQSLGLSVDSLVEYDIKMNLKEVSLQASSLGQLPYRELPFINAVSIELPRGVLDAISLKGEDLGIKERGMEEDSFVSASLDVTVPQVKVKPFVWNKGFKGAGKKIAVLDTGIDTTHKDFQGRIGEKRVFTGEESVEDGHGHGTHVAGIAAGSGEYSNGKYTGVAPEAEILVAKVLTNSGRGRLSWVIAGIEWAAEKGAHILNLSLGGAPPSDGTDALSRAVNKAVTEKDRVVCVAAGNSGPGERTTGSPGAAEEAVTVGSVDNQDKIADYSSRGPTADGRTKPDLVAPGGAGRTEAYVAGAWVASARSDNVEMGKPVTDSLKYREARGTSMATPHIAGVCALILQSGLAPNQVKERLKSTADRLEGYDENTQGAGRVNAEKALKQEVTGDVQIKFVRAEMEGRDSMGSHDIRRMRIYLKNEGSVAADDVIPDLIPQIDKQIHVLQPHGDYGTLTPGEEDRDSFLLETKGTPAGDYNLTLNVSYVKSGGEKETKSINIPLTVQSEAASSQEPLLSTLYESHTELQGKTEVTEFTQQHGLASWGEDRITDQERLVHLVSEDRQKFLLIRVDLYNQVQGIQSSEGFNVHISPGEAINKAKQEIGKATVEFKETNVFPTTTEESSIDERRPYWKVRLKIEEEGLHKVFTVCVSVTDGQILGRTLLVNSK